MQKREVPFLHTISSIRYVQHRLQYQRFPTVVYVWDFLLNIF